MSESASTRRGDVDELLRRLEARANEHDEARERVAAAGEDRLRTLQEHYEQLTDLMDRYESRIVSDGDGDVDMEAFIDYQDDLAHFMDHLPEELDHREAFETVDDIMHERYLKTSDFAAAREALAEIGSLVERLDERERARERYTQARHDVEVERHELDDRIADHERLVELGEADLDAPVEHLREPIETYDEAVTDAFEAFKHDRSAREVLSFVEATDAYPLVEYRQPPENLAAYVSDTEAGTETISTLLEYADYSVSKLEHYVEDARRLKRCVATNQTYLERLDAEALTIGWPAPSAESLRFRCQELTSVVGRFADDDVVQTLRSVRALADREDYQRLRDSAVARQQLDDDERERLSRGEIQQELQQYRSQRERLQSALEEYEPR